MSLPREQKKSQPPWQELALLVSAVAFVFYSVQSFLAVREPVRPGTVKLEAPLPPPVPERSPASQAGPGSTEVRHLGCLLASNSQNFESTARFLQLAGSRCGDTSVVGAWHGRNATTGEEILVFENARGKSVVTSFFSLKPGRNELVFEHELGHGRVRTAKIAILRKGSD